jgi:hypothetical protein
VSPSFSPLSSSFSLYISPFFSPSLIPFPLLIFSLSLPSTNSSLYLSYFSHMYFLSSISSFCIYLLYPLRFILYILSPLSSLFLSFLSLLFLFHITISSFYIPLSVSLITSFYLSFLSLSPLSLSPLPLLSYLIFPLSFFFFFFSVFLFLSLLSLQFHRKFLWSETCLDLFPILLLLFLPLLFTFLRANFFARPGPNLIKLFTAVIYEFS